MSFLSRLFGNAKPTRNVEAELKRREAEAESAAPGYVGTAFNRAGDLALKSGESDRALKSYGRAIDAFLQDAQREAARGVANKIIRVRPSAVRTLCTLTWLDLAARHQATALLHLRDYVRAARDAGQHARAATQIFEMGRVSADPEFVGAVADALDSLDFPTRAEEVREWVGGGSPDAISDPTDLGQACLEAAVRSNDKDQVLLVDVEPAATDDEATSTISEDVVEARTEDDAEAEISAETIVEAPVPEVAEAIIDTSAPALTEAIVDAPGPDTESGVDSSDRDGDSGEADGDAGEVPEDAWMESGEDADDATEAARVEPEEGSPDVVAEAGSDAAGEEDGATSKSSGSKKRKGKKNRKGRKGRKRKKK